jgi:hypothetical protein
MMLVLYHSELWTKNPKEDLIAHLEASGFECITRNCTKVHGWILAINRSS